LIYVEQVRALVPRARDAISGLSASQINWHPVNGSWSIAECIAHLNTTNALYVPALRDSFNESRRQGRLAAEGEPHLGLLERWFANSLEPPYKLKFKAPKEFAPATLHYEKDELLARWVSLHDQLVNIGEENTDLDWKSTKVLSPASRRIKISALGVFAIVAAHDRRHLWQAEQIRSKLHG
jgi:hypothetical protein